MAVRLTVKPRSEAGGAEKGNEFLLGDDTITIGRDKTCQLVLAQMAVSRNHARITRDGTLFFLEDLGSAYGTQVNGKPLPRGEKRLLRNGDIIAIAQFDVTFDRVAQAPRASEKTSFLARHVVKDAMRGLGSTEGPYLRFMNGPREGQRLELPDAHELIVGREEGVDLVLKDDLVSRRHVKLRRDWSGTHVEDLGSRNGIKVNKKKVALKTLKDRDELEIGLTRFLYLDPSEVRETPLIPPSDHAEEGTVAPSEEAPGDPRPSEEVEAPAEAAAEQDGPSPDDEDDPELEEASDEPEEAPDDEPADDADDEPPPDEDEAWADPAPEVAAPTASPFEFRLRGRALDARQVVPVVLMGLAALVALGVVVAMLAGA
jgi:pSer/pThr/pTyr-binding forkhead associated (FHA) protein